MVKKWYFINFLFLYFWFFIEICTNWLNLISNKLQFVGGVFKPKQWLISHLISRTIFCWWIILLFPSRDDNTLFNPWISIINEKHRCSRFRIWVSLFFNLKYFSIWLWGLSIFQITLHSFTLNLNIFIFLSFFQNNRFLRLEGADWLRWNAYFCLCIGSVIHIAFPLAKFFLDF